MIDKDLKKYYLSCGILEKWHDKKWKDFTNDEEAKEKILNYLSKAEDAKREGVGLYLYGANGSGKSLCMNLAFMQLIPHRQTVYIITLSTLITKFTSSWYNTTDREELYNKILNVDFLGIEEIGKEFKSSTDLGAVVLDSIIKYRVQRNAPTWATSNKAPSEIIGFYTEDIASMFKEMSVPVQVTGSDFRDKIKEKIKKFVK